MHRLWLAATLLVAPAASADGLRLAADPTIWRPPAVRLVWWDPAPALPHDFDEMASEVQAVFRPSGIEIVWRHADERPAADEEVNVVLLPTDPARAQHHRETMGRVQRGPHTAIWVFAAAVRATLSLGAAPRSTSMLEERREYPRALGRVVAHELVHAIMPDEPHATRGLMQSSLNRSLLTAPRLQIDERCSSALLQGLASRSTPEPERVATELLTERAR